MSTTNAIQHLIVHQLQKEPNGPARIMLHDAEVPVNSAAQRLVDHLCQMYGQRNGKGFGRFEDDVEAFPMSGLVRRYAVDNSLDFVAFSRQAMEHLQQRAEQEPPSSGGYVLFARVRNGEADFLFAAMVSEVIGIAVADGARIEDCIHLDLNNLRVAGRIDLGAWQAAADRYISFLRGRGDVAKYFKLFLGCNDEVTQLKETRKLVKGLEQFAQEQQMQPEVRDELFGRAHGYLDTLGEDSAEVDLAAVAQQVWPDAPQTLHAALLDEDLALSDGFVPDRRAIKPLRRFKASGPEWKLEFDRSSLRSGAVIYDKVNDRLVLTNIPDQLRKELLSQ